MNTLKKSVNIKQYIFSYTHHILLKTTHPNLKKKDQINVNDSNQMKT